MSSWKNLRKFWNDPLCRNKSDLSPLLNVVAYWQSSATKACATKMSQILAKNTGDGERKLILEFVRYCRIWGRRLNPLKREPVFRGATTIFTNLIVPVWESCRSFYLLLSHVNKLCIASMNLNYKSFRGNIIAFSYQIQKMSTRVKRSKFLVSKDNFRHTLSCQYLIVQCHQWKHQSYKRNLFKVNNKNIERTLKMCFNNFELIDSTHCSGVSIVNFDLVNKDRVGI